MERRFAHAQTKPAAMPDAQIEASVLKALAGAPELADQTITSTTVYGVVTLNGTVRDEPSRDLAEHLVANTVGVQKVVDRMVVQLVAGGFERLAAGRLEPESAVGWDGSSVAEWRPDFTGAEPVSLLRRRRAVKIHRPIRRSRDSILHRTNILVPLASILHRRNRASKIHRHIRRSRDSILLHRTNILVPLAAVSCTAATGRSVSTDLSVATAVSHSRTLLRRSSIRSLIRLRRGQYPQQVWSAGLSSAAYQPS